MDRKISLLYIVSTLKKSGPINVLYNIVRNLNKELFDIQILTLSTEDMATTMCQDFSNEKVVIRQLDLIGVKALFSKKIINKIHEISPDIVHSHNFRADIIASKISKYYPTITTIHNYPFEDYKMRYGFIKGNIYSLIHINAMKKIKTKISCSNYITSRLNNFLNLKTISNGIDSDMFTPVDENEKNLIKQRLGLDINKEYVLYVGSLINRKNVLRMIESFNTINNDNYVLLVVGDGELYRDCLSLKTKNVLLMGKQDNVLDFFRASDYFVSISKSEGLPMSVLEAMGAGLPVLLSDIIPHRELTNNGNGILVDSSDNNNISNGFVDLFKCDKQKMGTSSRNVLVNNYSAKLMANQYSFIYQNAHQFVQANR